MFQLIQNLKQQTGVDYLETVTEVLSTGKNVDSVLETLLKGLYNDLVC